MNFVDAIDHARAKSMKLNAYVYIYQYVSGIGVSETNTYTIDTSIYLGQSGGNFPVWRVSPGGKVERMTWTVRETIPSTR